MAAKERLDKRITNLTKEDMARGGRNGSPRKFDGQAVTPFAKDEKIQEKFLALVEKGLSIHSSCKKLRVSYGCPYYLADKNPDFAKRLQEAKEKGLEFLRQTADSVDALIILQTEEKLESNYDEDGKLNDKVKFKDLLDAASISAKHKGQADLIVNNLNAMQSNINVNELLDEIKKDLEGE